VNTIKALVKENDKLIVKDMNKSLKPLKDEVLVKVELGGVCLTDIYIAEGIIESENVILGHECSGTVVEIGTEVTNLKLGDLVSINPYIGCGECDHCKKNNFQLCLEQKAIGKDFDGVFSEYVLINSKNVVKFNKVSFERIAFFEPVLACSAVLNTSIKKESKILIFGKNRIADLTNRILKANGFKNVEFTEQIAEADYDYVIETARNSSEFDQALSALKPGGTLILKSRIFKSMGIDLYTILRKNIKIEPAYYYDNIEHVVEMIENNLYLDDIIGKTYKLDQYEYVFEHSLQKGALKVFLKGE